MTRPGTLTEKLATIGRRSPKHVRAFEALADFVLDNLDKGEVADPADYKWQCDAPAIVDRKPKRANVRLEQDEKKGGA